MLSCSGREKHSGRARTSGAPTEMLGQISASKSVTWIEAITPDVGAADNPDRVPDIIPLNEGGGFELAPRRQIELRISHALRQKRNQLERNRNAGLIRADDRCVVAISGAMFRGRAGTGGLPRAVTALYPIGEQFVRIDRRTMDIVEQGYHPSFHIEREAREPIPRYAFTDDHFSIVSGVIWSTRSIGNFVAVEHDFIFVHNLKACAAMTANWFPWVEEYLATEENGDATLAQIA